MPYKFNPFTGKLDGQNEGTPGDILDLLDRRIITTTGFQNYEIATLGKNDSASLMSSFSSISNAVIVNDQNTSYYNGNGIFCAELGGPVSTTSVNTHVVDSMGRILNLGFVKDRDDALVYLSTGEQVFCLFQCSSGTADGTPVSASDQIQISYIYFDENGNPAAITSPEINTYHVTIPVVFALHTLPPATRMINEYAWDEQANDNILVKRLDDLADCQVVGASMFIGNNSGGSSPSSTSNLGIGERSLGNMQAGRYNIAIGQHAMRDNDSQRYNIAVGHSAHRGFNTSDVAMMNVAIGYESMRDVTTGSYNVSLGANSMRYAGSASNNACFGASTMLQINGSPSRNVAVGTNALRGQTSPGISGNNNTAVGADSLSYTTSGSYNLAFGASSMRNNTTGSLNVAIGAEALYKPTTLDNNVAIGASSMKNHVSGERNICIGAKAGYNSVDTSYSDCIVIGYQAAVFNDTSGGTNQIIIGNSVIGVADNSIVIGDTSHDRAFLGTNVNINSTNTSAVSALNINGLQNNPAGLSPGDVYTQTATEIGGSGTTKILCIV